MSVTNREQLVSAIRQLDAFRRFLDLKYDGVRGNCLVYGGERFLLDWEKAEYSRLSKARAAATSACTSEESDEIITFEIKQRFA